MEVVYRNKQVSKADFIWN